MKAQRLLSEATARGIANDFLLVEVGDLLYAEEPKLTAEAPLQWVMSVMVANSRSGTLGRVGAIAVDALSGTVLFDEEEEARVRENARLLMERTPSVTGA